MNDPDAACDSRNFEQIESDGVLRFIAFVAGQSIESMTAR